MKYIGIKQFQMVFPRILFEGNVVIQRRGVDVAVVLRMEDYERLLENQKEERKA